jgi:steroid 5-alpha reductase family enzyme
VAAFAFVFFVPPQADNYFGDLVIWWLIVLLAFGRIWRSDLHLPL